MTPKPFARSEKGTSEENRCFCMKRLEKDSSADSKQSCLDRSNANEARGKARKGERL